MYRVAVIEWTMKYSHFLLLISILLARASSETTTSASTEASDVESTSTSISVDISSLGNRPHRISPLQDSTSSNILITKLSSNSINRDEVEAELEDSILRGDNSSSGESYESDESFTEMPQTTTTASVRFTTLGGPRGLVEQPVISYGNFGGDSNETQNDSPVVHVHSYSMTISHSPHQQQQQQQNSTTWHSSHSTKHGFSQTNNEPQTVYGERLIMDLSASEIRGTHAEAQENVADVRPRDLGSSNEGDHDTSRRRFNDPNSELTGQGPADSSPSLDSGRRPRPPQNIEGHSKSGTVQPQSPPPIRPISQTPLGTPSLLGGPQEGPHGVAIGRGPVFPQAKPEAKPPLPFGSNSLDHAGFTPGGHLQNQPVGGPGGPRPFRRNPFFGLGNPPFNVGPAEFNPFFSNNNGHHFNRNQFGTPNFNGLRDVGTSLHFAGFNSSSLGGLGGVSQTFDGNFNGFFGSSENDFDNFGSLGSNPFLSNGVFGSGLNNQEAGVHFNPTGFAGAFPTDSFNNPSGLFGAAGPGSGLGETNSAELAGSLSMNTLQAPGGVHGFTQHSQNALQPRPVFRPPHQQVASAPVHRPPSTNGPSIANPHPTQGGRPYHIIPGGNFHIRGAKSAATDVHYALRPYRTPPCAESARGNMTYCTIDNNYPHESVVRSAFLDPLTARRLVPSTDIEEELAFAESNNVKSVPANDLNRPMFRLDLNGLHEVVADEDPNKDSKHHLDQENLNGACSAEIKTVQPMRAKNTRGAWKVIVNVVTPLNGQKYTQYVRIETCRQSGTTCDQLNAKQPSKCLQKQTTRRLAAWSPEEGLHVDTFYFPVACTCHVA